ncbi:MAG TPA: hypothetical protein VGC36_09715, partial [Rhizomicrobium sp.]
MRRMARKRKVSAPKSPAVEVPKREKQQSSLTDYLSRQRSLADISLRKIIERSGIPGVVLREIEGGL